MRKQRIFAMVLAATVFMQSMGTSAYAAGAGTMREATVSETVAEENLETEESEELTVSTEAAYEECSTDEAATSEEEPVTEESVMTETEETIVVEETGETVDMDVETTETETSSVVEVTVEEIMETTVQEVVDNVTQNYLVDTSLGVTIKDVVANPGSYHVDISWISQADYSSEYWGEELGIVYTADEELGNNFFPDVTGATESDLSTLGYKYTTSYENDECNYLDSNDAEWVSGYNGEKRKRTFFSLDFIPGATYYYRLIYFDYNTDEYKFLTLPSTFKMKEEIETTKLSYSDTKVVNGYGNATITWKYDNPDNEYIYGTKYVYYTDADAENFDNAGYVYGQKIEEYTAEGYESGRKFTADIPLNTASVKIKIVSKIYTGAYDSSQLESEEIIINRIDIDTATITKDVKAGTGSVDANVEVTPYYQVDDLRLYLYYREKTDDNSNIYLEKCVGTTNGILESVASNLIGNTEYEYYLEIKNGTKTSSAVLWSSGSSEEPLTITTGEVITYEDSAFPDEVFREEIRNAAGIGEEEAITSDKLEKITEMTSLSISDLGRTINSIEGIQYLPNLREIYIEGHNLTDAKVLEGLTKLTVVSMEYNDLKEMPDLSAAKNLSGAFFSYNKISRNSFVAEKVPEGFLATGNGENWIDRMRNSQREDFYYVISDTYYAIENRYPFALKASGLKGIRDYIISVTIDGKTVISTENYYNNDNYFAIQDLQTNEEGEASGITIEPGEITASITITDVYGNTYLSNETVTFIMKKDTPVVNGKYYLHSWDRSLKTETFMTGVLEKSDIQKIELLDPAGTVVGRNSYLNVAHHSGEKRYGGEIKEAAGCLHCDMSEIQGTIEFSKYLSAGDYDLKYSMSDGTYHIVDDVVHVTEQAVVTEISQADGYDSTGEYVYIYVTGYNLDTDKCYPVLYLDGEAITGTTSAMQISNNEYIYKLQKINMEETWIGGAWNRCAFGFVTAEGYSVENKCDDERILIKYDTPKILLDFYNYKKKVYEVYFNDYYPDGTEFSFSIYGNREYTDLEASATAVIKDNKLELVFVDSEGNEYIPKRNTFKYFMYEYEMDTGYASNFISRLIEWYNYSSSTESSIKHNTILYQESMMKELLLDISIPETEIDPLQSVRAQISTKDGTVVGNTITLSCKAVTSDEKAYYQYTGTWENETGLSEGIYTIAYMQGETTLATETLYVYDNSKFYMRGQYAMNGDMDGRAGTVAVQFASEQLYGNWIHKYNRNVSDAQALEIWNENYNVQIFDLDGNEITGWKIESALYKMDYITAFISGLSRDYAGFYYRITDKEGNLAIQLRDGKVFYEADEESTPELGRWITINYNSISFSVDYDVNAYVAVNVKELKMYPLTLVFAKPGSMDAVKTLTIEDDDTRHAFTEEELSGISNDELYYVTASSATGAVTTLRGYFAVEENKGSEEEGSETEEPAIVPTGLTALTNVDKTLADVSLEAFEGWYWQNPDTELAAFAGQQKKSFMAYYQKDEETEPVYKTIEVDLSTVKGISLKADRSKVLKGENANINLEWNLVGTTPDMSEYEESITWNNTNSSVATVSGNGISVSVNAVAKGKTILEAAVKIGEETFKARTSIAVVDGKQAKIQISGISDMTETAAGSSCYESNNMSLSTGTITGTITGAGKLNVKSSSTKVLGVKKAVINADGTFSIPYVVNSPGTTKLTFTANDALKTSKEIIVRIKDAAPSLSTTTISVNRLLVSGESIYVYPSPDGAIKSVELVGADKDGFIFDYDKDTKKFFIATKDETVSTGKKDITVQVAFENENLEVWKKQLNVKVVEKKPSFKVKQSKKVNLFMDKNVEMARLNVTASDDVKSMKLADDCAFEIKTVDGEYFVAAKENGLNTRADKKGTLMVTYENYRGEYSYNFTVGLERKAPKITVSRKTSVLYPEIGINEAKVNLLLNKEVYDVSANTIRLEGTEDYKLSQDGNDIILSRTNEQQIGKVNAKLVVTNSNWAEEIKVPVILKVNKNTPKLKLSKTSVQLNSDASFMAYDTASVQLMWKDGAVFESNQITVTETNEASKNVLNKDILFEVQDDTVTVRLSDTAADKTSYKFKVNAKTESGYTASQTLTVKVVPVITEKAVKISAKGNIDVLNREGSHVTVTPAIKGINGTVVKAELAGAFAHLFEEPVIENGKILLYAKEDANLITKYNYKVRMTLTVENVLGEMVEVTVPEFKIKFKQGKAKITATPKNSVFYSNAYNSTKIDLAATLKGAADPKITAVELLNNTKGFDYSYDYENQRITVTMNNNGEAVKGKSYNLQFKVTLAGQADNEKAIVVKYKVTVK